jgi:hypothetical protein
MASVGGEFATRAQENTWRGQQLKFIELILFDMFGSQVPEHLTRIHRAGTFR